MVDFGKLLKIKIDTAFDYVLLFASLTVPGISNFIIFMQVYIGRIDSLSLLLFSVAMSLPYLFVGIIYWQSTYKKDPTIQDLSFHTLITYYSIILIHQMLNLYVPMAVQFSLFYQYFAAAVFGSLFSSITTIKIIIDRLNRNNKTRK